VLWDPADSEHDDTDTIVSDQEVDEPLPLEDVAAVNGKEETTLPSEEAIINQFGEEFGRDILSYLQQRTQLPKSKPGKKEVWTAPANEDTIFARATELWKRYRERQPSPERTSRTFDKTSFERAVFGMEVTAPAPPASPTTPTVPTGTSRSAFEEAVFGQQSVQYNEHDSYSDEWTEVDDEQEARANNAGELTSYEVDRTPLRDESPNRKRPQIETPIKLVRTPSRSSVTGSMRRGLSAKARDESEGNMVSGLIVASSDEEEDYLDSTPAIMSAKRSVISISSVTPESSPVIKSGKRSVISVSSVVRSSGRERSVSSPLRTKSRYIRIMDDDDDEEEDNDVIIIEKGNDTKGRTCGDPGYRCTKAFCFTCVA